MLSLRAKECPLPKSSPRSMLSKTAIPMLSLILAIAAGTGQAANQAEQLLRAGKPIQAWQLLRRDKQGLKDEEAAYWKGRALLGMGRLTEAAELLEQVPAGHPLYPYAARGLLYCAKHSPEISCTDMIERLTHSQDEHIRALASAALADQQLSARDASADTSAYSALQKMAQKNTKLQSIVKLLGLPLRRKMNDFAGGIEYARELENDSTLDTTARHFARLELAELYYAKESAQPHSDPIDEETDDEQDAAGLGEETLLQFITANPESPLLQAAFCRLHQHEEGPQSSYTRSKLHEWAEDTAHARRAAFALILLMDEATARGADTAALANRAVADLPGEPLTRTILQEHTRRLILRGDMNQAELYTRLLESFPSASEDADSLFLRAMVSQDEPAKAAEIFTNCAEIAPDRLRILALVNAMICHMRNGDQAAAEKLIRAAQNAPARRALLLAHAQMLSADQAEQADAELREVMRLQPSKLQAVRARVCLLRLHPPADPLQHLYNTPGFSSEERAAWSDEDELLYAAILEKAADNANPPNEENTLILLRRLCEQASSQPRKVALSQRLADRLSRIDRHAEARDVLLALAGKLPSGEQKASALLHAGKECVACATLPSLQHAVKLYAECARMGTALAPVAVIEQASVLTRIGRHPEALDLLESLPETRLSPELRAHRLTILADAYAATGDQAGIDRALATSSAILDIPDLPHVWFERARLQHAAHAARARLDDVALQDYLHVVKEHDKEVSPPGNACDFFYYYAGAGAVHRLTCLNRFSEAAQLAEHIAAWSGSPASDAPRDPKKAEAFLDWARAIRSTHFLPGDILSGAQRETPGQPH